MSTMFREYREKLLQQLSLDLNCTPADFLSRENVSSGFRPAWVETEAIKTGGVI